MIRSFVTQSWAAQCKCRVLVRLNFGQRLHSVGTLLLLDFLLCDHMRESKIMLR